ncbi:MULTISPECIES: helix-turn-helix domain-containing protein [unclassified Cobetia]|uniref:helix-turn-helix domain-containing protein n=1 Tax=unclassified Cobetia TaxID=2609414 RepID=UPI002096D7C0|nr:MULTISPECIES: XRE family transcriptional regulator [unclassified Cobetia]MCO7230876.1 XRE family transcriptional regulator [Cobetia sp. Dlab-2-AX]MCO7234717.1 XRE family transcriptional regulator [Cobetia sp. Dlab-2-U]
MTPDVDSSQASASSTSSSPSLSSAEQEDRRIGRQLRDLRKSRQLTLSQLAERVGKSVGYLSQVERGVSSLPIGVLQTLSDALDVRVSWFFQPGGSDSPEEQETIVRADHRRTMNLGAIGAREELLSPRLSGQLILIMTCLQPGGSGGETPRERRGEEAGYVESGQLELTLGEQVFLLNPGDSFSLTGEEPHWIRNPGETETRIIWVMTGVEY